MKSESDARDKKRALWHPKAPMHAAGFAHHAGTFEVLATQPGGSARAGRLWTAHGSIETPCFMPVGTYGAVKGMTPEELVETGSQIILGNAYHLGHRPGAQAVARWGGLHKMMGWSRPILTDSGGFQVFSLRGLQKIDDSGVDYQTHFDGSKSRMTPRSVLEVQAGLGSDICMILDHCPPGDAAPGLVAQAMERTTRWAHEAAHLRREILAPDQLCFAIVQGGTNLELRKAHIEALCGLDFDGFALGGLSVGEPIDAMHRTIAAVAPLLPTTRPRYVMGIGTPVDLLVAVQSGVDMFDCVMPTRHARNGQLFTFQGKVNIRRAAYRDDLTAVDANCPCYTCRRFSRAYLRHLHQHDDPLYVRLATLHNLAFYHEWVGRLRESLHRGTFGQTVGELQRLVDTYYRPGSPLAEPDSDLRPATNSDDSTDSGDAASDTALNGLA